MLFSLLASAVLSATPAFGVAQTDLPQNDGWVTDLAGVLSDAEERSLEALMESYRSGTTHEIAVLTVPSLEGRSLESYSLEVARFWGIGAKDENNGALFVVAVSDRKMRIEVGRGLEGTLTDSISGRIIRDVVAPEFKKGDYHRGIRAGVEAIHAAIGGDYGPIERSPAAAHASRRGVSCAGAMCNLVFILLLVASVARSRRMHRSGGMGGILPWLVFSSMTSGHRSGGGGSWGSGFGGGGGGFGGFGGGGGFSGGGASGGW